MEYKKILQKTQIILCLAIISLFIAGCVHTTESPNENKNSQETNMTDDNNKNDEKDTVSQIKTFNLSGENFKFIMDGVESPDLIVNKGDTVKITFTSAQGVHNWTIDEFMTSTPDLKTGETRTVEFVADKEGTFEYYCSVGSHRANGMTGNLIVK